MTTNKNTLILVDGSGYLYRAFHALPPLTNSQGMPTGAIYGITNMLKNLLAEYQPTYVAVVFDARGKTFRHDLYTEYKANRPAMPDDLSQQIPWVHELIQALGFPLLAEAGVEADDVIGTLAKQAESAGMQTLIFTGDKDFAQLVNDHIILVDTMKNTRLDTQGVQTKFGIPPELMVDYLSLIGDTVDNVPGVNKVGPKTAVKWLDAYGSLSEIMKHADKIKGKVGENLRNALNYLPLTQQLVTIKCDVPLSKTPAELTLNTPDNVKLYPLYETLAFKQWLNEVSEFGEPASKIVEHDYQTILTEDAFSYWLEKLQQSEIFAVDTETTSLNPLEAEIVGISFAVKPYEAAYLPLTHDYIGAPAQLEREKVFKHLRPILENPKLLKVGQNLKYDFQILKKYNIQLQGMAFDTMLESYILESTTKHDMDSMAQKHLQHKTIPFEQVAGKGKKQLTFNQIDLEHASPYAAEDADVTLQLHHVFTPKLQQIPRLKSVLTDIEMPLVPILANMENNGVKIDANQLYAQSLELSAQLAKLETEVHQLAGKTFNLNSPKQLQTLFFDELKLPVLKKTPKGEPSTAVEVLEELAADYPLPQLILQHRSLSKLKSTYTDALPKQISPHTGRVHTSYHQAVTATGRLSSTDPNLQNIPIRTAEGRRIRQAFVAPKDYVLLAADYSQIELRIMAHLSQDEKLLTAFANHQDIHQATAAEVFQTEIAQVTSEQRRKAKAVNFGLIYGMQAFGLAKQLGIERKEAQTYIDTYFERYPQVKAFMEATRELARQQGYVETVFGRRLYVPEINSRNYQRRQYAERSAINAPMQGTAADIIKLAMIKVDQWIQTCAMDVKMLLQVHDELVFEVPQNYVEKAKAEIGQAMINAAQLKVPLVVDIGMGENWEQAY